MQKSIVWEGLLYDTEEHCNINYLDNSIMVRSEIDGWADRTAVYVEYVLHLDLQWQVLHLDLYYTVGDTQNHHILKRLPTGWQDNDGNEYDDLGECPLVDISLTPLTNTLPINHLSIHEGQTIEIEVVYFNIISNELSLLKQRYTKLDGQTYRFENADGSFTAIITVDADGFVTHYPQVFEMLTPQ